MSRNVIRKLRSGRKRGGERRADRRQKGKLRVGLQTSRHGRRSAHFWLHRNARWRPNLLTAVFMALRASELRGLRWEDVDLIEERAARPAAC